MEAEFAHLELDNEAGTEELSSTELDVVTPHISLASNGFELQVGTRVLGARELARYYRQRHRPPSTSRAVALAAANNRERGLACVGVGATGLGAAAVVTKQQARQQKVEYRTKARLRMATEISANGPQFRGFRDA